jgi:hypothetical protein
MTAFERIVVLCTHPGCKNSASWRERDASGEVVATYCFTHYDKRQKAIAAHDALMNVVDEYQAAPR